MYKIIRYLPVDRLIHMRFCSPFIKKEFYSMLDGTFILEVVDQ